MQARQQAKGEERDDDDDCGCGRKRRVLRLSKESEREKQSECKRRDNRDKEIGGTRPGGQKKRSQRL